MKLRGSFLDIPISPCKIVNEQLLQSTHESLYKIENSLEHLERRIEILEKAPKKTAPKKIAEPKPTKEVVVEKMQKVVADPRFSDQERKIVDHITKQGETDAESIAKQFQISRSNSSLKLNKLYNWGYLEKRLEEKTVFYRIKD